MRLSDEYKSIMAELKAHADKAVEDNGFKNLDEVKAKMARLHELEELMEQASKSDALLSEIKALNPGDGPQAKAADEGGSAQSLGEWVVKSRGKELGLLQGQTGTVAVPEFKASTDVQVRPAGDPAAAGLSVYATEYQRDIIGYRRPLKVVDLLGTGTISGNSVAWLEEGTLEGGYSTVAEGGQKPQLHFTDPTLRVESLKKIAGYIKFSEEMLEDFAFLVSEINNRGLYELALSEEIQVLTGDGNGSNLRGLLNISGILAPSQSAQDTAADAIYKTMTAIYTASGYAPDGLVMNPLDYEQLRLSKDGNGQYYGGGYFAGAYGNSSLQEEPPVWGKRTVSTPSIPQGTVLIGAFRPTVTFYRKGGIRVESTNSHADDFTSNLVTTRLEERVALTARVPSALAKLTLRG